jgi:hypothetical protein
VKAGFRGQGAGFRKAGTRDRGTRDKKTGKEGKRENGKEGPETAFSFSLLASGFEGRDSSLLAGTLFLGRSRAGH